MAPRRSRGAALWGEAALGFPHGAQVCGSFSLAHFHTCTHTYRYTQSHTLILHSDTHTHTCRGGWDQEAAAQVRAAQSRMQPVEAPDQPVFRWLPQSSPLRGERRYPRAGPPPIPASPMPKSAYVHCTEAMEKGQERQREKETKSGTKRRERHPQRQGDGDKRTER